MLYVWFSIIYILYICLLTYVGNQTSLHMYLINRYIRKEQTFLVSQADSDTLFATFALNHHQASG